MKPLVSLCIPVFNGENYLEECIRSLIAQPRGDIEILISDNASTDATEEICREFSSSDRRIVYLRQSENMGAAWNFNECFRRSRGEFFSWTGHDDIRPPDFVDVSLAAFDAAGHDYVMVSCRSVFIDGEGESIGLDVGVMPVRSKWAFRRLGTALNHSDFSAPFYGMIRRETLERTRQVGAFEASDIVFISEVAMLGKVAEVEDVLLYRRLHLKQASEMNTSKDDLQNWLDPKSPPSSLSYSSKLFVEHQRSIGHMGLGLGQRVMCHATVPAVMITRRSRVISGRWRRRLLGRPMSPHPHDIMLDRLAGDGDETET